MDWATMKPAIVQAVKDATGITDVVWENSSEASYQRGEGKLNPFVDLKISAIQNVGQDLIKREFVLTDDPNPGDGVIETTIVGQRSFTLTVSIYRFSQKADEETVGILAQRLRTRLGREEVRAALATAELGISGFGPTAAADYLDPQRNNRMVSKSVTDVFFNAVENDVDVTAADGWFNKIGIAGGLPDTDLDGMIGESEIGPPPD